MSFSFGSATTSQSNPFGGTTKPAFSFGGTNTATTSTAGFGGFGTSTTSSGFGTLGSTSTAPFGSLGSTPATTAPSLFGGTGFGSAAAKPTTGFGAGFGTSTFGTGTGFGANTSFSAPQQQSTFGTNTFGTTSAFGTGSTFGNSFGKPATTGFGGFGTGLGATPAFGQQQKQQPQQQQQQAPGPSNAHEALVAAVFNCAVFGDERDQVLAKWNLLQAQWGNGQAYYSRNAPALELNEQNPLCRFKAVGYSRICGKDDADGHVAMIFNKPEQEIKNNQQGFISSLSGLLGNKPNLAVNIETVEALSEKKCQVVVYVVDKNNNMNINASELSTFLNNGSPRSTLNSAGCGHVAPVTKPTSHMLQQYLNSPPPGMDLRLWKQAQADNPDPENYIPVPMIGFTELKFRAQRQSEQASLQASYLRQAAHTLSELRVRRASSVASLANLAARFHSMRHSLLTIIARREVVGRVGVTLSPEEEALRLRLQELGSQLSSPPLYNGRLNELLCAVRLQRSASAGVPSERYQLDPGAQEDVKQFLSLQQRGMAHLMETARQDLATLNTIAEGMSKLIQT
ncbi:probable nucleoporin Nup54 [Leptidea sinapis]|uniref:probable nucleoporin Nup54 n=1 Tax=Leptidea sinapis TaxID=189913 RepID=UPI002133B962|nr:probable nucleoporin Nup54 [Leptidea sinapis]